MNNPQGHRGENPDHHANHEPTGPASANDEPTNDEPTNDEPTNDEPTNDEPTNDEPTNDEPTNDEPTTQQADPRPLNVVTGAFGYTGRYIARMLLLNGQRVETLTGQDPPAPEDDPKSQVQLHSVRS